MQPFTAADLLRAMESSVALEITRDALHAPDEGQNLGPDSSPQPRTPIAGVIASWLRGPRRLAAAPRSGASS